MLFKTAFVAAVAFKFFGLAGATPISDVEHAPTALLKRDLLLDTAHEASFGHIKRQAGPCESLLLYVSSVKEMKN